MTNDPSQASRYLRDKAQKADTQKLSMYQRFWNTPSPFDFSTVVINDVRAG